jgi:hypothetical protein
MIGGIRVVFLLLAVAIQPYRRNGRVWQEWQNGNEVHYSIKHMDDSQGSSQWFKNAVCIDTSKLVNYEISPGVRTLNDNVKGSVIIQEL